MDSLTEQAGIASAPALCPNGAPAAGRSGSPGRDTLDLLRQGPAGHLARCHGLRYRYMALTAVVSRLTLVRTKPWQLSSEPSRSWDREASFPVVFFDRDSGLVSGYQLYRFETDGTATVLPRVEVGKSTTSAPND